jgi:outer membrane protein OmpA-like peptidoglycan-associated protein
VRSPTLKRAPQASPTFYWRILAPAGYGATHPAATNTDAQGRDINRRVDVKVLVNKGLEQGI